MAFTSNKNLISDPFVTLKDYQHAADLFNVDQFRLAPKFNFLFHVAFSINKAALKNTNLVQRYGNEINMLVKSVQLPNWTVQTEVLNQYNRTKVVQFRHKPMEIEIKFHDDNMGLINQLWQNYYSYYYADSTSAKKAGAYNRTATKNSSYIKDPYGLDTNSSAPFFNYIKIYQMARHEYVEYKLINPVVTLWNHNSLDYSEGNKTHDFSMKLLYEAVAYDIGQVSEGTPEGFGLEHYDKVPSPLSGPNPDPTVYDPSFVQALDMESAAPSILSNTIGTINAYQNYKLSQNQRGTLGVTSIVGNPPNNNATIAVPQAAPTTVTPATQVNIV